MADSSESEGETEKAGEQRRKVHTTNKDDGCWFFLDADDPVVSKAVQRFRRTEDVEVVKTKWSKYRDSIVKVRAAIFNNSYRCVGALGTGTKIVGASTNFVVGGPGPEGHFRGPIVWLYMRSWIGPGPKISVQTPSGPGLGPIK